MKRKNLFSGMMSPHCGVRSELVVEIVRKVFFPSPEII